MNKTLSNQAQQSLRSILPLVGGLVVAGILIALILAAQDVAIGTVWDALYEGAWERPNKRARVLESMLPLLLCSAGLLITFSAGLWNIGIEGQLTMGAVGAAIGAMFVDMPNQNQQVAVQILIAAGAGGSWALFAAILKTRGGVNEIFGGVALNFIATLFSAFMIGGPMAPERGGTGSRTNPFDPDTLYPSISIERAFLSYSAVTLAVVGFLLVAFILYFTHFGLQLKSIGRSPQSSLALGIPTERNIWLSMTLCGVLAGIGGTMLVMYPPIGQLQLNVSGGIGFLALLVVLLASIRPWLVPIIVFAFSFLNTGAQRIESSLQLDSSLIDVLQGILVLIVLLFDGVRQRINLAQERRAIALQAAQLATQQEEQTHE